MASGALFGNAGAGRSQNKNLVEFRAGKMELKKNIVHPDKRKGLVYVYQSDDSLMHFCWRDRAKNKTEDDLIIFPDDVEFKAVPQCTTGRVFLLRFKSNSRKMFFWMQEPKSDKDEELCRKLNDFLNNPPSVSSSRSNVGGLSAELAGIGSESDLQSILGNMNQQQLMQLLGGMGSMQGLSSLLGGRSSSMLSDSAPPSRIQSSPGTMAGTQADSQLPQTATPRPVTAGALSSQSTFGSTAGSQRESAAPPPVVPPAARINLADVQNILAGFGPIEAEPEEVDLSLSLNPEAMVPILANTDVQQRLSQFLPVGSEDLPQTEDELRQTIHSPQFRQALRSFSAALASGQLGPLMRQFGVSDEAMTAAAQGDMAAFARALQEAYEKDSEEKKMEEGDEGK